MDKTTGVKALSQMRGKSQLLWVDFLTVNIWLGFSASVYL